MCKNADNPCPGCKEHKKPEAAWMFFTEKNALPSRVCGRQARLPHRPRLAPERKKI